jgi:hypothetical protein
MAAPLLAMAGAGAVAVWGALFLLPWATAGGCLVLLAALGAHLAINEREAPSSLRLMLGTALVLLAGAALVKVSGWQAQHDTLNVPSIATLADDLRKQFQRQATMAGFQAMAWGCLLVATIWLLRLRPPFGTGALAIVAGLAMLAGAATDEAQNAWTAWQGWQSLSAELGTYGDTSIGLVSTAIVTGPYLDTGLPVGAALLGTTLTVLACARLSAAGPVPRL